MFVCVHVGVCELGALGLGGGGEMASHKRSAPVLKAGHPGVPCYICLFVCMHVGVCELGALGLDWIWIGGGGGGELASHKRSAPVLKAGHPGVPCYICLFGLW